MKSFDYWCTGFVNLPARTSFCAELNKSKTRLCLDWPLAHWVKEPITGQQRLYSQKQILANLFTNTTFFPSVNNHFGKSFLQWGYDSFYSLLSIPILNGTTQTYHLLPWQEMIAYNTGNSKVWAIIVLWVILWLQTLLRQLYTSCVPCLGSNLNEEGSFNH